MKKAPGAGQDLGLWRIQPSRNTPPGWARPETPGWAEDRDRTIVKLLHFTDIHITLPGDTIDGLDPRRNFAAALEHAAAHHPDASCAVATGDLTNWGEIGAYQFLQDCIASAPWPMHLLLGNHDDRQNFQTVFADYPRDPNGFVQYVVPSPQGRLVLLDTKEPETHAGRLCERRLAWFQAQLAESTEPVLLFMHHHPMPSHVPGDDVIGLLDPEPFRALVARYRNRIRHIFFGHCHLILSGSLAGVPTTSLRGTNHQGWPDFADPVLVTGADLAPMYGVVFVEPDHVAAHAVEFTYCGPLRKSPTEYAAWAKPATSEDAMPA